jgi:hypothetical protein
MINEILAPDKKEMFRNKYILEKASETVDVISTGDKDRARPSVYWTSVRLFTKLNKADIYDNSLAKTLGIVALGCIHCFVLLYVTCTKITLCHCIIGRCIKEISFPCTTATPVTLDEENTTINTINY